MHDVAIPPDAVQDPVERNLPGLGLGRDPERTPMQWDATPNAGFSSPTARTWLPLAADSATVNVASQLNDSQSMLTLYRRLIELRGSTPALSVGSYRQLYVDADLLIFARDGLTIVLNFSHLGRELPNGLAISKEVALDVSRHAAGPHPAGRGPHTRLSELKLVRLIAWRAPYSGDMSRLWPGLASRSFAEPSPGDAC